MNRSKINIHGKKKQFLIKFIIIVEIISLLFLIVNFFFNSTFFIKIQEYGFEDSNLEAKIINIEQNEFDINVIPDKYNTGFRSMTAIKYVDKPGLYDGIYYKYGSNETLLCLDFYYNNENTENIIYIENKDFSGIDFAFYHFALVKTPKKVIFNNCNFSSLYSPKEDTLINVIFNNCSFKSFYGSNATFNNCYFGGSYLDALVPFRNINVNNCYISDLSYVSEVDIIHSDGTQIYGYKDLDAKNIFFTNTRFEIPLISRTNSKSSINACIMIQLEYSNGINISFENCIINGGGFSIYAWTNNPEYYLSNVRLDNIKIGCMKKYGNIYPEISEGVMLTNIEETNSLYIGSVWKDESNNIHLSVTNDTNSDRTLLIYTEQGWSTFSIPACPLQSDFILDKTDFSELPFDIDLNTNQKSSYIVCFDNTENNYKQIRFVNWSNQQIFVPFEY